MWLILGLILVVVAGMILIVVQMAFQQREQDRKTGKQDDCEDTPVFMIGFTDMKR